MSDETETTEEVTEDAAEEKPAEETSESKETTEDKGAEAKPESEGKDTKVLLSDDEDDGAGGVPEKYEFVTTEELGELNVTPEAQKLFDDFEVRAKDAKLTQAQYQQLVEGEIKRGRSAMEQLAGDYQQRIEDWADVTKKDKELGGDDLAKNLSVAKLGMDTFGTPELQALFDAPSAKNPGGLGLGNHPEIIRLLHRAGLQVKESELIEGDTGDKAAHDASLKRMYPSMFKDEAA